MGLIRILPSSHRGDCCAIHETPGGILNFVPVAPDQGNVSRNIYLLSYLWMGLFAGSEKSGKNNIPP